MKPLLLSLLTGLLFAFSLPPFDWEWLGWVAFAPLFVAAQGRRPLEAVGLGDAGGSGLRGRAGRAGITTQRGCSGLISRFCGCRFCSASWLWLVAKVPAQWNPALRVLFIGLASVSAVNG